MYIRYICTYKKYVKTYSLICTWITYVLTKIHTLHIFVNMYIDYVLCYIIAIIFIFVYPVGRAL